MIEKETKLEEQQQRKRIKLLLLGTGESGKSTIFKQIKIIYGENQGYTTDERTQSKVVIYDNILVNLKALLRKCETHINVSSANQPFVAKVLALPEGENANIDVEVGEMIQKLWADPGVQATWKLRAEFQVQDALKYYCADISRIMAADYLPNNQDILRARVRTSGIVEEHYNIDGVSFVMYDVGGQRNERKKWIHCFDGVTAVIFVAAINEYNQVLYEDARMNRMDEAVILFDEICNSRWFKNIGMILFLNKRDLFREKLPGRSELRQDIILDMLVYADSTSFNRVSISC